MRLGYAKQADVPFLLRHDHHIRPQELECSVRQRRVLLAWENEAPIGWLRWNLFWDNIPFMNLLFVLEPYRGKGCGAKLVGAWEREMREREYTMVLTSTLSDETSQCFYRKLGYADSGALVLPGEPLEIIFRKSLAQ